MSDDTTFVGSIARAIRWLLLLVVTAGLGFGGGWYFSFQRTSAERQALADAQRSTERQLADVKAATAAKIADLEKQVLEAQKAGLERALERAKRRLGVDDVLESLAVASLDAEGHNFGRALQEINQIVVDLARTDFSTAVRQELEEPLNEIRGRLEKLDPTVGERIMSLARDLEQGLDSY